MYHAQLFPGASALKMGEDANSEMMAARERMIARRFGGDNATRTGGVRRKKKNVHKTATSGKWVFLCARRVKNGGDALLQPATPSCILRDPPPPPRPPHLRHDNSLCIPHVSLLLRGLALRHLGKCCIASIYGDGLRRVASKPPASSCDLYWARPL